MFQDTSNPIFGRGRPRAKDGGLWNLERGAQHSCKVASYPNTSRRVHEPIKAAQLCLGVPVGLARLFLARGL